MNITITITNPTVNALAALAEAHAADNAKMMESLDKASTALDVLLDEIAKAKAQPEAAPVQDTPAQDAPIITPQADPQDTALRIATVSDIDDYLDVECEVHWKGQKYEFDGVVDDIRTDDLTDDLTDDEIVPSEKIVFIRRNDTDKLVSLTLRDLQTGRLTLID